MSRIGKKPVAVPKGVTATINGQTVSVKGPKGELTFNFTEHVTVELGEGGVNVAPRDDSKPSRAAWGMSRTMIANLMKGVTDGFSPRSRARTCSWRSATATTWSTRFRPASRSSAPSRPRS